MSWGDFTAARGVFQLCSLDSVRLTRVTLFARFFPRNRKNILNLDPDMKLMVVR